MSVRSTRLWMWMGGGSPSTCNQTPPGIPPFHLIPTCMMTWARPRTSAAPPMSFFISRMPAAGLMLRPPESNVTPLPTSTSRGREALWGAGCHLVGVVCKGMSGE